MRYSFLEEEFIEFKKSANEGYKIAKKQQSRLRDNIESANIQIKKAMDVFSASKYVDSEASKNLEMQLNKIRNSFEQIETRTGQDIEKLKKNLSFFSITLFGRTMAGKSTLMEFLKKGRGESIGKGAQRTTRDVRTYEWNNLLITDIPGIGAFEGQEDEAIAFEAAKNGDIILFLITDDAPQFVEAECFSQIINLGKPIIVILNIKFSISQNSNLKLAIRDIDKKFDKDRIAKLKKQFRDFSVKFGQDWNHIPIVPVHLKAAFDSTKIEDKELRNQFYKISRVDFLQKVIVETVKNNGKFYRIKTFVDTVDNPMINSMETLLEQSNQNSSQARIVLNKKRDLEAWREKFIKQSIEKVDSFLLKTKSDLRGKVAVFAEEHYEDRDASGKWKNLLTNYGIEEKCHDLIDELDQTCTDHLHEISRQISSELSFSNHILKDKSLNMDSIINWKKGWNWGTLLVSGGLGIAGAITSLIGLTCAGPLGWAALAVGAIGGLLSFLFKDKNKEINEARQRLEEKLNKNINSICVELDKNLKKCIDRLAEKRINTLIQEIQKILNILFSLGDGQKALAWNINRRILELNKDIITDVLKFTGYDGMQYHIKEIARIPGQAVIITIPDGDRFPDDSKKKMQDLMREEISFVYETENKWLLLSRIIGKHIDRRNIRIEDKIGVAHIPIKKDDLNLLRRVRLAQQLTELLITQ